jgi:hypothetical protein
LKILNNLLLLLLGLLGLIIGISISEEKISSGEKFELPLKLRCAFELFEIE